MTPLASPSELTRRRTCVVGLDADTTLLANPSAPPEPRAVRSMTLKASCANCAPEMAAETAACTPLCARPCSSTVRSTTWPEGGGTLRFSNCYWGSKIPKAGRLTLAMPPRPHRLLLSSVISDSTAPVAVGDFITIVASEAAAVLSSFRCAVAAASGVRVCGGIWRVTGGVAMKFRVAFDRSV